MATGALIAGICQDSIAQELGLEPGDRIIAIDNQSLEDLIDYRYLCAGENLELTVLRKDGEEWAFEIEKDYDEDLGIIFEQSTFDGIKRCQNKCIFCFVDQMPPGMRDSLYIKDDDYRMSFLHGNFVTLTNLKDEDLDRIIKLRLSPLYISVHTTNPELRQRMLNNKRAGRIMEQLNKLKEAGLEFHAQIVLCPGVNDGDELERTLADLTGLYPSLLSAAIVPVGLTAFRQNLYELREFTTKEAQVLAAQVDKCQAQNLKEKGDPLVYLADEFYLIAKRDFPPSERYGDYPQLENGIGLVRLFLDDFEDAALDLPDALTEAKKVLLVTGVSGAKALAPVIDRLKAAKNLDINIRAVENRHFGPKVTASGLLTGSDLRRELKNVEPDTMVIIPAAMLRSGEQVFLDDSTMDELSADLGLDIRAAGDPWELVQLIVEG